MGWLITSLYWYAILLFLGIIFFPLTKKLFGKVFFDYGYPFSKVLAILFLSYSIFVLGTAKILSFNQLSLLVIIVLFIVINFFISKKLKSTHITPNSYHVTLIIFEEILFLTAFIFWVYVRGQEPSVRGLEKFMDFGFINSILRSKYFPPLDMWLSANTSNLQGFPINYYYFGHLVGSSLIKLTGVKPAIGYNLILATIFALGVTQVFSLVFNMCYLYLLKNSRFKLNPFLFLKLIFFGLVASYIVNLGGNLHTIYVFSSGYPTEKPIPFWQILTGYHPSTYWYPNATRFIPFTIHEFPLYSYVVADLHGHVFDIPFVLLTLAILFKFFISFKDKKNLNRGKDQISSIKYQNKFSNFKKLFLTNFNPSTWLRINQFQLILTIFLGFLTAVHYMTNAIDGPIYLLLTIIFFLISYGISYQLVISVVILFLSFVIFSLPFSAHFTPFISGIGVNCSLDFLTKIGHIGPFLFEKGNCQISPFWMLFVLWGFFWIGFIIFLLIDQSLKSKINNFIFVLFSFGVFLITVPEFFYIKDIYPVHFRANTMFKLGYQAFIMMGIASGFVFFQIKFLPRLKRFFFNLIFLTFLFFITIYPAFAIPSYYGTLKKIPQLDGSLWLTNFSPGDKEIIDFLNNHVSGQPVILEAQGDSYTDYERISAYTGLPTVAGWWDHEWLWRGSPDVIGKRIPDVVNIFESEDIQLTKTLVKKYQIKYIIVSRLEKEKYSNLRLEKFNQLGRVIFQTQDKNGLIYQIDVY
ncbi:hypothetical protein COY89_05345 [Candidatus Roizmanbacteria bacterium CG_4_10_14_0_8_um_filter_36_36]|uniref:YYY membrane protein n=1 Tax=Candidatus Roizmanbacteria bacterium CG10_big_fil_rev_8_21_14_0_10_36_26 TaxID=1974851 RepID=A0A2M8KLF4_9BACT|nr:MAG: hypothetical protein COY89_05345 [Candidatus Roizmanbacteria bacterium CG_4_10_14_0_8_um_filter_36_36]PJE60759.1 MAG: hypothetical protein COU86_02575 [Candidatus Roizmanbacteria bacterium CG10_big_fil_rev_8_21_14_0_10_36_26]